MNKELFGNPTRCIRVDTRTSPRVLWELWQAWLPVLSWIGVTCIMAFCVWAFVVLMAAAGGTCN